MDRVDVYCHKDDGRIVAVVPEEDGELRQAALLAGVSPSDQCAEITVKRRDDGALLAWAEKARADGQLTRIGTALIQFVD